MRHRRLQRSMWKCRSLTAMVISWPKKCLCSMLWLLALRHHFEPHHGCLLRCRTTIFISTLAEICTATERTSGMDKPCLAASEAIAGMTEGASILIGGFGVMQGWPHELLFALRDKGVKDLTIICNSPGFGPYSPQILAENRQIK